MDNSVIMLGTDTAQKTGKRPTCNPSEIKATWSSVFNLENLKSVSIWMAG